MLSEIWGPPLKAKRLKSDMVRAYAVCPGVTQTINVATGAGVPGCAPPSGLSQYKFGEKGSCKVQMRSNIEPLSLCDDPPFCSNPKFTVTCKEIEDAGGSPTNSDGWLLRILLRQTAHDPDAQDVTLIDMPLEFHFPAASNGKLKLKADLYGFCFTFPQCAFLPVCSSLHVQRVAIVDPNGDVFAVMGSSTR